MFRLRRILVILSFAGFSTAFTMNPGKPFTFTAKITENGQEKTIYVNGNSKFAPNSKDQFATPGTYNNKKPTEAEVVYYNTGGQYGMPSTYGEDNSSCVIN